MLLYFTLIYTLFVLQDNREYNDRTSMEMVADFSETHSKVTFLLSFLDYLKGSLGATGKVAIT